MARGSGEISGESILYGTFPRGTEGRLQLDQIKELQDQLDQLTLEELQQTMNALQQKADDAEFARFKEETQKLVAEAITRGRAGTEKIKANARRRSRQPAKQKNP